MLGSRDTDPAEGIRRSCPGADSVRRYGDGSASGLPAARPPAGLNPDKPGPGPRPPGAVMGVPGGSWRSGGAAPEDCSPLSQPALGEARDNDGVKRFLGARDGDAQGAPVALQLHRVADGARGLLLIYKREPHRGGLFPALLLEQPPSLSQQRARPANSRPAPEFLLHSKTTQKGRLQAGKVQKATARVTPGKCWCWC